MLQLKRWNTPTIYNGWEQITSGTPRNRVDGGASAGNCAAGRPLSA